jgi:hypothetical protein
VCSFCQALDGKELEQAQQLLFEPPWQLVVGEPCDRCLDRLEHRRRRVELREARRLFQEPLRRGRVAFVAGVLRKRRPHLWCDRCVGVAKPVRAGGHDAFLYCL